MHKKTLSYVKGESALKTPAYFVREAAHYLRLPASTVRRWISGRAHHKPLVVPADQDYPLLSFQNLLELHVLCSLRGFYRLKLPSVRQAVSYLRKRFNSEHPLIDRQMLTDGTSLFIDRYGQMVNISQDGQLQMKLVLDNHLKRIEWSKGLPIKLFPFTRTDYQTSPRFVAIDPTVKFGKPCISGTGIPTSIIAERYTAGDSIRLLAEDYGRTGEEIEEAIRYESRAAA